MKRALTATFAFSLVAMLGAACSANDTITPGSAGSSGTATGSSGSGAVSGSGTTSGGTNPGAGTSSGGSQTGVSGSGGSAMGGSAMGGSAMGGSATGGASGSAGTGGGTGGGAATGECTGDCTAVLGKADGWVNSDPPIGVVGSDGTQGVGAKDGVATTMCVASEGRPDHGIAFKEAHWQLKGPGIVKDQNYAVTFHFTGVLECKVYIHGNCTRAANNGRAAKYNLWCPGGMDPTTAEMANHWNTVMVSVTPTSSTTTPNIGPQNLGPLPAAGNWWMLNECPLNTIETHQTWLIDNDQTITVPGESWINFVEFDTNCKEIINCGSSTDSGTTCGEHFSISPPGDAIPAAPGSVTTQPAAAGGGAFGQWLFFDVKSVKKM